MTEGKQRPVKVKRRPAGGKQRAPEELEAAMLSALDNNSAPTASEVLDAAGRLLDRVLQSDCEARAAALDLLTVDALMTRALEIANRDPASFEVFSEQAMRRVASAG
ncbi:MAG: hypothetical protein ABJB95_03710 [Gemmatimonadales bacterium]